MVVLFVREREEGLDKDRMLEEGGGLRVVVEKWRGGWWRVGEEGGKGWVRIVRWKEEGVERCGRKMAMGLMGRGGGRVAWIRTGC
jgi:hypothetical protein